MAAEDITKAQQGPKLPQKRYFRQRAHVNIFNDMPLEYPLRPSEQDWSTFYPTYFRSSKDQVDAANKDSQQTKRPISPTTQSADEPSAKRGPAATTDQLPANKDSTAKVEFADIGCGYGGLLVALSPLFPNTLMVGMEIRTKVVDYLQKRIEALREFQHDLVRRSNAGEKQIEWVDVRSKLDQEIAALHEAKAPADKSNEEEEELHDNGETHRLVPGHYENIASMRINCQKYLPNFFEKAQLSKLFILFADPHFKRRKHKARIISATMLAEYAYIMRIGGIIYTITDVKDLHDWNVKHLDAFPLFERIPDAELENDPAIPCVVNSTEEGKKVARNKGEKHLACYRRIEDPAEQ
ncbi:tRNA (guanine-N(7)-)-methyltransferase (tRNA(m7G46)-methyltransferase) [Coemansia sp. RSA 1813]|nr:tRNA (guanine-N(7)-)-methyltransferase (tRNA(m7G46)-methyltransferase) [Coemansia sp. RSA 1646]KAJ1773459.1 tRNA (guanine-N(7)-)-methyltransferase (tRNA(m7G46)-methyltransferase) [Coemansia sp. RSA 1843]KAJ2091286.1 tRNA (guanine-N(7)-)-methyltransferase (tRNA(m7G46)-methyltransferase) [Coemansia sp. RSA 986]KAJ2216477.1 tRNA (guanine-N(7)-)-methyltransferase (tRNA(m7G46)-methyltransferase) [Coemansia sp. RSA 487]KAJ2571440.1 tRNA (guanine-N(7)-)-methyltransferase (tRNA(m7G46)-methyltransfer